MSNLVENQKYWFSHAIEGSILMITAQMLFSICGPFINILYTYVFLELYEPVREKTNNLGSDQVQHKPDCTVTEDG